MDFNEALSFIQKADSTGGSSLYDHLTSIVQKVLEERPSNAIDLLETTLLIKKAAGELSKPGSGLQGKTAADAARAVAALKLFVTPDPPLDPETGEPLEVEPPREFEAEDVLGDGALLEALGCGLGRAEMYGALLAVKALGSDPARGIASVRFFGKLLGTHADYYVFEATLASAAEEGEQAPLEGEAPVEVNSGANAHVYFVCNHLGGPLVQLPPVTPAQIKASRAIKKLLTGRLSSQVSSYPLFPGTEANYLRALIARIAATTVACPAGMFEADEEGGIARAEDYSAPPALEMGLAASWCHRYPHLKAQGRCELHKREEPEDEEEAASFQLSAEEQEEGPELLAALEADAEVCGRPAWSPLYSSSSEHVMNQVVGLRSNLWPGAFCACQGGRFTNIYVGWGIKNAPFVPQPPPPVAGEFDQMLVESKELPPKPNPESEEQQDREEQE